MSASMARDIILWKDNHVILFSISSSFLVTEKDWRRERCYASMAQGEDITLLTMYIAAAFSVKWDQFRHKAFILEYSYYLVDFARVKPKVFASLRFLFVLLQLTPDIVAWQQLPDGIGRRSMFRFHS